MGCTDHLKACIDIELKTAEVYSVMERLFPEARELFRELSLSEEEHANVMMVACGLEGITRLSDTTHIATTEQILETYRILGMMMEKADKRSFTSLSEALSLSLLLESSAAEGYMDQVMREKADAEIVTYLKTFYEAERSHFRRIEQFMAEQNLVARS
jgi:hypothetical protein